MAYLVRRCAGLLAWTCAAWAAVLALPPLWASIALAGITGALLRRHVLRPRSDRDRATLRLRPPGAATPWLLVAVPAWIVFDLSLAALLPVPADSSPAWLEPVPPGPLARLPLALLVLGFVPLWEEILFRGYLQRSLERRLGAAPGILLAAALFAALHFESWRFVHLWAGGIVFGAFVQAARSLWAGVALHAAANACAALLDARGLPPLSPATFAYSAWGLMASFPILVALLAGVRARSRRPVHRVTAPSDAILSPVPAESH